MLRSRRCFKGAWSPGWILMRITRKDNRRRLARALPVLLCSLLFLGVTSCVKRTVTVPISPKVREAKTATLDDLLRLLEGYAEGIRALTSTSMRVTFSSGRLDSGRLEEYRSAPGYVLLRRPDSIRVNIQNPVTKTTILELLSRGNDFSIWYPRENKFFTGSNSAREFEVEGQPGFSARPLQLFEAILPQCAPVASADTRIAFEEDRDSTTKYYVLSFYRDTGALRLESVRRLWIDRSNLAVARVETFTTEGARASIIRYSNIVETKGFQLPLSIKMERPIDGYLLEMQFRDWRVNPDLPEAAFVLNAPEGSERIRLKEKGRSAQN